MLEAELGKRYYREVADTHLSFRLPATSANLGPGFDALGLAMRIYLQVEAEPSDHYAIAASGRDADLVGALDRNLMIDTYRELVPAAPALSLRIHNEIPLGMGCGSSAAALLAGVLLANHFGGLGWSADEVVTEASRREGHPDNVAACYFGGLTASTLHEGRVVAASLGHDLDWRLLLAFPAAGLATSAARAMLPAEYARAKAVQNIQSTALLVSAFALARMDLLAVGTRDCLHQPYRSAACPLLGKLMPLVGEAGIGAVTLSGAGPSVLLICDPAGSVDAPVAAIRERGGEAMAELVVTSIAEGILLPPW